MAQRIGVTGLQFPLVRNITQMGRLSFLRMLYSPARTFDCTLQALAHSQPAGLPQSERHRSDIIACDLPLNEPGSCDMPCAWRAAPAER